MGYMREEVFARRDDDGTVFAQRVQIRGILALASSFSGNKRMELENPDFNAATNTR